MSQYKEQNTYFTIDCAKIILSVMIVALHSLPLFQDKNINLVLNSILQLSVPMFFAFSGFFYAKDCNWSNSIKRLGILYIFWMIFSWPLCFNIYEHLDSISIIRKLICSGLIPAGWYIIALIWCIIITIPLKYNKSNLSLSIFCLISIVFYLICVNQFSYKPFLLAEYVSQLDLQHKHILNTLTWSFPRGLIFFLIGFIFRIKKIHLGKRTAWIMTIISFGVYALESHIILHNSYGEDTTCTLSTPLLIIALTSLILFYCIPTPYKILGYQLRKVSTMLYMSHPMIMFLIYHATGINVGWERFLLTLAVFSVGLIIYNRLIKYQQLSWLKYAY